MHNRVTRVIRARTGEQSLAMVNDDMNPNPTEPGSYVSSFHQVWL